jgi:hypothetical protein
MSEKILQNGILRLILLNAMKLHNTKIPLTTKCIHDNLDSWMDIAIVDKITIEMIQTAFQLHMSYGYLSKNLDNSFQLTESGKQRANIEFQNMIS